LAWFPLWEPSRGGSQLKRIQHPDPMGLDPLCVRVARRVGRFPPQDERPGRLVDAALEVGGHRAHGGRDRQPFDILFALQIDGHSCFRAFACGV
jgi:hypothetical protein